jgi:hypothetical protein
MWKMLRSLFIAVAMAFAMHLFKNVHAIRDTVSFVKVLFNSNTHGVFLRPF